MEILEDLRTILGPQIAQDSNVQGCDSAVGRMESIQMDLDHVHEPGDELLEAPLTIYSTDLARYFAGQEGNPLRYSYERFLDESVPSPTFRE